jgi:fructokinase
MRYRTGVDLGGTKTEIVVINQNGDSVYRHRVPTPSRRYEDILGLIADEVERAEREVGARTTVGIGIPGAHSPKTGLLRNSNTVVMNGRPFLEDIRDRLEREVRIENDANCFALSEALAGAGRGHAVVFGVIIGTGTGGGIVVDGKLVNGPHAISGEWGHNPLPWHRDEDGEPLCYCGKRACIETFLSGPGLAASFERRFGERRSSREIEAGALAGDRDSAAMMALYYDQMARALAHLINILDPGAIVFGGGMSNIDAIYRELPGRLADYVFSDFVATPLLKAEKGDASGVFGAAMLWH